MTCKKKWGTINKIDQLSDLVFQLSKQFSSVSGNSDSPCPPPPPPQEDVGQDGEPRHTDRLREPKDCGDQSTPIHDKRGNMLPILPDWQLVRAKKKMQRKICQIV